MYSASSTESRCSLLASSASAMREYDRLIMRTPVLITLWRSLCNRTTQATRHVASRYGRGALQLQAGVGTYRMMSV